MTDEEKGPEPLELVESWREQAKEIRGYAELPGDADTDVSEVLDEVANQLERCMKDWLDPIADGADILSEAVTSLVKTLKVWEGRAATFLVAGETSQAEVLFMMIRDIRHSLTKVAEIQREPEATSG